MSTARPTTPGRRHATFLDKSDITADKPLKALTRSKRATHGRNNQGKITVRHRGGGVKRRLRVIDFKRNKIGVPGKVATIEYDPNRTANIALISYMDGDKRYILAPDGLQVGDIITAGPKLEIQVGNSLPLSDIPIGTEIHNIEMRHGKGGQLVRGAGTSAILQSKEEKFAAILLPSKELRLIPLDCYATIGTVSNQGWKNVKIGKAGRKRLMGFRPTVRGTAQHPGSHPHGGGEGRSGIGMKAPKTPWGKKALGLKTRSKKKYSNKYILRDRRVK